MLTADHVETALQTMTAMLAADGYELHVAVDGETVDLEVRASDDVCEDCLVPKSVLAMMAADLLDSVDGPFDTSRLAIRYPAD